MDEMMYSFRFVAWGSYDKGKPRVRLLLDAIQGRGALASQIHIDVWRGIEDKAIAGTIRILSALMRLVIGYPAALVRLAKMPRDRIILLLYPAILDIFAVWPVARLRRQKIVFDAFISFYDTIVDDRKRLSPKSIRARWLWHVERSALRLADVILVDTDAHGRYFSTVFRIPPGRFVTVPVGAEPLFWEARHRPVDRTLLNDLPERYALFYGQFIPLHGIETILAAVAATDSQPVHWLIIGSGQEDSLVRKFVESHAPKNLTWLPWIDYAHLPDLIRNATVSLGIFGATEKAARVVPNKMYQILAAGGSIITRESPAVAELAEAFPETIFLVPPADPESLAAAVLTAFEKTNGKPLPLSARDMLSPHGGIDALAQALAHSEKCPS